MPPHILQTLSGFPWATVYSSHFLLPPEVSPGDLGSSSCLLPSGSSTLFLSLLMSEAFGSAEKLLIIKGEQRKLKIGCVKNKNSLAHKEQVTGLFPGLSDPALLFSF